MKAITIWQPWASLLACGAKRYETRSWATNYRGQIAIHAAKKDFDTDVYFDRELYPFADALNLPDIYSFDKLPKGCIIATAELVGCYEIASDPDGAFLCVEWDGKNGDHELIVKGKELIFGDFTPGRYAWEFANVKMLDKPIPVKGKQRLWDWSGKDE